MNAAIAARGGERVTVSRDLAELSRNFDKVPRMFVSCRLTAKRTVATPVNWQPGQAVIIPPAVSDEAAKAKFPGGWKTEKPYLRVVVQPA